MLLKRPTAGGFRRWWWPLNVHVIRFSRWVIDETTTTTTTVMSPTTPLELSPALVNKQNTHANIHVSHDALGRRQTFIRVSQATT
jgi:hypothetical protein